MHAHAHGHRHETRRPQLPAWHADDLKRVADAARGRFRLGDFHLVSVEQLAATERGFPPFETRITFWTGNDSRHQYRVFKPAAEVMLADLPPWWMKDAIIVDEFPAATAAVE